MSSDDEETQDIEDDGSSQGSDESSYGQRSASGAGVSATRR